MKSALEREFQRIKERVEILWGDRGGPSKSERAVRLRELPAPGDGGASSGPEITRVGQLENDVGYVGAQAVSGMVAGAIESHEQAADPHPQYAPLSGPAFTGVVRPSSDNSYTLGAPSQRWSVVHAGTGTISTSDAREKTPMMPLTDSEIAAAQAMLAEIGAFQWLASVAEKGDAARTHLGLTVQRAIEIMAAHGLDAMRYAFICYDRWEARPAITYDVPATDPVLDEDDNEIEPDRPARTVLVQDAEPAGDRYGFRHDQLILFLLAGEVAARQELERRIAALEAASP